MLAGAGFTGAARGGIGESRKKIRRKCEKEREKERKFRNGIVTNFWIVTNSKKE
jgi:hypothetical protein